MTINHDELRKLAEHASLYPFDAGKVPYADMRDFKEAITPATVLSLLNTIKEQSERIKELENDSNKRTA